MTETTHVTPRDMLLVSSSSSIFFLLNSMVIFSRMSGLTLANSMIGHVKEGFQSSILKSVKCYLADEKSTLFHQYLRYSHKRGTIVFSILSATI